MYSLKNDNPTSLETDSKSTHIMLWLSDAFNLYRDDSTKFPLVLFETPYAQQACYVQEVRKEGADSTMIEIDS